MSALSLLVVTQLAATPITLDEVRQASRQSLDAIRAQLDVTRAESSTKTARSVIFPQLDLNLGAGVSFIGSQRAFSTVPTFENGALTGFEQKVVNTQPSEQGRFTFGLFPKKWQHRINLFLITLTSGKFNHIILICKN